MPLSRRRILELTGAAAAAAALPAPRAFAGRPASFSQDLTAALPVPRALAGRPASFSQDLTAALPAGARIAGARRVLPVMRAPRRFELIGLDFGRAGHVHAEVRARRAGRAWSGWAPLHDATQPCWTGPADEFQVRFEGVARSLRARFVTVPRVVREGARGGGAQTGGAAASGGAAPGRTGGAKPSAPAGGPPPIIPRADWHAEKAPPRGDPDYGEVQIGFVHHTVTASTYEPEDSASIVLGIARYHIDHNGWNDIGYNFLVDQYGQIFEGRAGGIDQPVLGAQAQGYNSYSTGVACLGDYTSAAFTAAGLEAVAKLLAWKLPLHGAPVRGEVTVVSQGGAANRYASGRKITFERISGHRDGDATSCPGDALYAQLDDLRERVADLAEAISALSIRVEENRLQYPETAVALTGLLRFDDGGVPTGQPIQLQFRSGGGDWTAVQDVSAAPDGSFAAALTAPASGRLRAVYGGDGVHPPLESAPVRIRLQPEITIDVFPRRIKLGRRTAVSGTVTPAEFADVAVLVQRRVGGIFYKTSRHRVAVVDGAFKTRLSLPRKGFYRVTVSAGGGSAATTCRCA